MNDFTSRKIRRQPDHPPLPEKTKQNLLTAAGILLIVLSIVWIGQQVMRAISGSELVSFVSDLFGKELQTDDRGHTNILLLGVGGEGHSGKDLTDTIMIASIDMERKKIAMLSIPRDLYVDTKSGGTRVNRLYEMGKNKWGSALGLEFAAETIQEKIGIPLHYRFKLDFEAFKKIVDSMDGIDVFVEATIDDPAYPDDETYGYEPFYIEKGLHHLDGKTALKYVRSRHSSSDFGRSERQQQTLLALKKKAAEKNFLSRKRLLKELYETLREHLETNLSLGEMLRLAEFASEWDGKSAATATLSDEWSLPGGFLYPPLRELYGGAYVLLPAGDTFESVQRFAELTLYGPSDLRAFPVSILNGTGKTGLASSVRNTFQRYGVRVAATGNAAQKNMGNTTWYAQGEEAASLIPFLQELVPGALVTWSIPQQYLSDPKHANSKIILEIGKDSLPSIAKLDIFRNVVALTPMSQNGTATASSGTGSSNASDAKSSAPKKN